MHKLSIVALIAASLVFSGSAFAQGVSVNAGATTSTNVGASAAGTSVNAGATTSTEAGASASTPNNGANTGTNNGGNSGSSSAAAADASSSGAASASGENATCGTVSAGNIGTGPIDATMLAGVTSVTVFSTDDCSGIAGLNTLDAGAGASLAGNAAVTKAITDAGYTNAQIAGYVADGTSLTIYVKK